MGMRGRQYQVLISMDKAIQHEIYDKPKLINKKISYLIQFTKSRSVDTRQNVIRYFNQKLQQTLPFQQAIQILNQKYDYLCRIKQYNEALQVTQMISQIFDQYGGRFPHEKKLIILKKIYLYHKLKNEVGFKEFLDRLVVLSDSNIVYKLQWMWRTNNQQQVNKILNNFPDKGKVYQKLGTFIMNQAMLPKSQQQSQEQFNKKKRQNLNKSIQYLQRSLKYVNDYRTLKEIMQAIHVCYQKQDISKQQRINKGFIILQRNGLLNQFLVITYMIQQRRYNYYQQQLKKNQQKQKQKFKLLFKQLQNQKVFTFTQFMSKSDLINITLDGFCLQYRLSFWIKKLYKEKKYKKAFEVFIKLAFYSRNNVFISDYQEHQNLRKCYKILQLFKLQNYQQCLDTLKILQESQKDKDLQDSLVSINLYKTNELALIMQKIKIQSLWKVGKYQLSSKLLTDLIFVEGNFINYITPEIKQGQMQENYMEHNVISFLDRFVNYMVIVKYNSLKYSQKQKKFRKCLKKAQQIENLLNGDVRDPTFHLSFARYYYQVGQQLKVNSQKMSRQFIDSFCLFIQKYNTTLTKFKLSQQDNLQLKQIYQDAKQSVKQIFNHCMIDIQQCIQKFRDLYNENQTQFKLKSESLKQYITNVDDNFFICIKIINYKVLEDIGKSQRLKQKWIKICQIVYRDILRKNINICYEDIQVVIKDVRNALRKNILTVQKESVTFEYVNQLKSYYKDQLDAIAKDRKEAILEQIQAAYKDIEQRLQDQQKLTQNTLIQKRQIKFINQSLSDLWAELGTLVQANSNQAQKNQFLQRIIADLKQKSQNWQNPENKNQLKQTLISDLKQICDSYIDTVQKKVKKNQQQMDKLCQVVQRQILTIKQLPQQMINKEQVLNHYDTQQWKRLNSDKKYIKKMMKKVLDQADNIGKNQMKLQEKLDKLDEIVANKGNLYDMNSQLTELLKSIPKTVVIQKTQVIKQLIKDTQIDQNALGQTQINVIRNLQKNLQQLYDTFEEKYVGSGVMVDGLKREVKNLTKELKYMELRKNQQIQGLKSHIDDLKEFLYVMNKKVSKVASLTGYTQYSKQQNQVLQRLKPKMKFKSDYTLVNIQGVTKKIASNTSKPTTDRNYSNVSNVSSPFQPKSVVKMEKYQSQQQRPFDEEINFNTPQNTKKVFRQRPISAISKKLNSQKKMKQQQLNNTRHKQGQGELPFFNQKKTNNFFKNFNTNQIDDLMKKKISNKQSMNNTFRRSQSRLLKKN